MARKSTSLRSRSARVRRKQPVATPPHHLSRRRRWPSALRAERQVVGPTARRKRPTRSVARRPSRVAKRPRPSRLPRTKLQGPLDVAERASSVKPSADIRPPDSAKLVRGRLEERFAIPTGYGETRIVLMVKDPWWLYAYWEVDSKSEREARSKLSPAEVEGLHSVLRVYDVTDLPAPTVVGAQAGRDFPAQPASHSFDIPLSGLATNWYIHVNAPNRSFVVDIGLLTKSGRFLTLARSNRITTPRFGPSEIIDEEWMISEEDYWKLFGVTAGIGMGSSPGALKALLERKLFSPGLFSPGLFSPMKVPPAKGFWLWVDTELIVYGATNPKAIVMVQGEAVKLKPDGSFSVRVALPDGTQSIPVEATSPDRRETKTLTSIVTRRTEGQPTDSRQQTTVKEKSEL